jgi:hypothetical protein
VGAAVWLRIYERRAPEVALDGNSGVPSEPEEGAEKLVEGPAEPEEAHQERDAQQSTDEDDDRTEPAEHS